LSQPVDQKRDAVVCTGIDERGATTLNDQMARVLQRPRMLRIDRNNAIVEYGRLGAVARQALLVLGRFETVKAREIFCEKSNIIFRDQCGLSAHHRVIA
jgi:hypothetical protein